MNAVVDEKPKIRVIKGDAVPKPLERESKHKRSASSDIASIVTGWIRDLHVRKSNETKAALEKFFTKTPQPGMS